MIGAYGYGALSDPGSIVASSMTALLTIFIALLVSACCLGSRRDCRMWWAGRSVLV
jgi:hypothetical protein